MKPYPKIKTLFERNTKTFKVIVGHYKDETVEWLKNCGIM